jgi:hypothetical protein
VRWQYHTKYRSTGKRRDRSAPLVLPERIDPLWNDASLLPKVDTLEEIV